MNLVQLPSGMWRVDFVDATGERRRLSCRTRDKRKAQLVAAQLMAGNNPWAGEAEAPEQKAPARLTATNATMNDLFDHCLTTVWANVRSQATLASNLKVLRPLIGDDVVRSITTARLATLRDDLQRKGYAPATIKRKLDNVGKALTAATEWEIGGLVVLPARPRMPEVKQPKDGVNRRRILSHEEEEALFAAIDRRIEAQPMVDWRRYRLLIRFLLDTGVRLGEAVQARIVWIVHDGEGWVLVIPARVTKGQRERGIPLTQAVVDMLPILNAMAGKGPLFPYSQATVWQRFNSLREDVKQQSGHNIDDVVVHSLRHTCLTRLAQIHPIQLVSLWAGHSNVKITMDYYLHHNTSDLRRMVGTLEGGGTPSNPGVRVNATTAFALAPVSDGTARIA